jgi:hypothetical protein
MTKLIYLLWPRRRMLPLECRLSLLEDCAPALLRLGVAGLQMNIADDRVDTPSPAPQLFGPRPFAAEVCLWLDEDSSPRCEACEDVLRGAGFELAGYRVDEWLYAEYGETPHARPRDWPDGERSPGVLAVTLIQRPARIPRDEWLRRWFGWQSPMSEWMQPRARYVRNLVEAGLTPDGPALDGIVEEVWPSREHVTNKLLFYGARDRRQLICHMAIMLRSVSRMLRLTHITTVMMSEYFVKTPDAGRR